MRGKQRENVYSVTRPGEARSLMDYGKFSPPFIVGDSELNVALDSGLFVLRDFCQVIHYNGAN